MHGDVSSGGPAKYHLDFAKKLAEQSRNLVAVAMIRPGYDDGAGNTSSGEHNNRSDHYTADNVDAMADGVRRLRERYQASRVVLVGHSGGAATSALILGRKPGVADAAVLVACPCNVGEWRRARGGRPWPRSESPHEWAGKVPSSTRVIAITGADDSNTKPGLAEEYVALLKKRGVDARFIAVASADHNGAWFEPQVMEAVIELVR
jgi:pimeloyl-ACP methyl ester carboxylesterase